MKHPSPKHTHGTWRQGGGHLLHARLLCAVPPLRTSAALLNMPAHGSRLQDTCGGA